MNKAFAWLLLLALLPLSACVRAYRVVPATPAYLLQSPDAARTPFPAVLKGYNRFEPGDPYMDLHPLMGLRIENAYYEKGAPRRGLAGFLGTEVATYTLTAKGLQLGSVRHMPSRPAEQPPVEHLIPKQQEAHRYYRFYFEIFLPGSGDAHASALLSADSQTQLDAITDPATVCHPGSTNCTVFPEACSVSVEAQVTVNGKPQSVVWGDRLDSLVTHAQFVEVKRLYQGHLVPVKLNAKDPAALRLPLLPGDQIRFE